MGQPEPAYDAMGAAISKFKRDHFPGERRLLAASAAVKCRFFVKAVASWRSPCDIVHCKSLSGRARAPTRPGIFFAGRRLN
jgi:hypothetical protein